MTTRRTLLTLPLASALAGGATGARAQALAAPRAEELRPLLESPAHITAIVDGTIALRTLLLFSMLGDKSSGQAFELRMKDREPFLQLMGRLRAPEQLQAARKSFDLPSLVGVAMLASQAALPVAARMQEELRKGGLQPGSPYSSYLLRSFLQVDQAVVLSASASEKWYCKFYPFSAFCG